MYMPHSLATCWAIFVATNGPPLIRAWSLPTGIASIWPGGNPTSPPSHLHLQRRLHRGASKRSIWSCWPWSGLQREKGACARTLCRLSHMLQLGGRYARAKDKQPRWYVFPLKKKKTRNVPPLEFSFPMIGTLETERGCPLHVNATTRWCHTVEYTYADHTQSVQAQSRRRETPDRAHRCCF